MPPTTEDKLKRVTIGEPTVLNGPIALAESNPEWPAQFESLAKRIESALGGRALQIEHVGSTSVPGLAAKPIIDILLVVADSADEPSYVPALEAAGFVLRTEPPCLLGGLSGDRKASFVAGPFARKPSREAALRADQTRAGKSDLEIRPGLRRCQNGSD